MSLRIHHNEFSLLSFFFIMPAYTHIQQTQQPPDVICQVSLVYSTQLLPIRNPNLILLSLSNLKSSSHLTSLLYPYMAPLDHYKTLSNYRNNPLLSRGVEKIIQVHWYSRKVVRQFDIPVWDSFKLP